MVGPFLLRSLRAVAIVVSAVLRFKSDMALAPSWCVKCTNQGGKPLRFLIGIVSA